MLTSKEFICYHGTTHHAAMSIINNGFKLSTSCEDWLGHGVYFFIDGISNPLDFAIEWTKNKNKHERICVIKAKVNLNESDILDLSAMEGLKKYNIHREKIINEFYDHLLTRRDVSIKKRKDMRVDDCIIMGLMNKEMRHKAIIHNVYIKNSTQRTLALESSYPNSTVLCVSERSSIKIVDVLDILS